MVRIQQLTREAVDVLGGDGFVGVGNVVGRADALEGERVGPASRQAADAVALKRELRQFLPFGVSHEVGRDAVSRYIG